MPAPITAVIVAYNSSRVIGRGLEALSESVQAGLLDVIVVDNASRDGTANLVRTRYPDVRVIDAGGNIGFGRGCNLGAANVKSPYLLFINPDASLPKEALERLKAFLETKPKAFGVAPATWVYDQDQLQTCGGLPTPASIVAAALGRRLKSDTSREIRPGDAPFPTDWLGGGIMLLRTADFHKLGGFDPAFFLYFEETDLCKRAIDAGYELWAVGEAVARHEGGTAAKDTGEALLYGNVLADPFFRSRYYYLVKHFGWPQAAATEIAEVGLLSLRTIVQRIKGATKNHLSERLGGPIMRRPIFPGT